MSDIVLFNDSFISPQVQAALPKGYTLRPLRSNDYERGFLDVLRVLTEVGDHTKEKWLGKSFTYAEKRNKLTAGCYRTIRVPQAAQPRM